MWRHYSHRLIKWGWTATAAFRVQPPLVQLSHMMPTSLFSSDFEMSQGHQNWRKRVQLNGDYYPKKTPSTFWPKPDTRQLSPTKARRIPDNRVHDPAHVCQIFKV